MEPVAQNRDAWSKVFATAVARDAFLDALPLQVFLVAVEPDGMLRCEAANRVAAAVRNCIPADLAQRPMRPLLDDDAHRHLLGAIEEAIGSGTPVRSFAVQADPTSAPRLLHASVVPVVDGGRVTHAIAFTDPPALSIWSAGSTPADLAVALDAAPDIVARFDDRHRLVYVNRAVEEIFARPRAGMLGKSLAEIGLPEDVAALWEGALTAVFERGESGDFSFNVPTVDGYRNFSARLAPDRDDSGRTTSVIVTTHDVTEQTRLADSLAHLATHDPVTHLPNRRLLLDRLGLALARAGRSGALVAVLFIDLDEFKRVNDTWGHAAGDHVLRVAAERITTASRAGDTVANFGGDEFVVLCEDVGSGDVVDAIADRIVRAMTQPIDVGDGFVAVRASVGVAVGAADQTAEELIVIADHAMYARKAASRQARSGTGPEAGGSGT